MDLWTLVGFGVRTLVLALLVTMRRRQHEAFIVRRLRGF